MDVVTPPHLFAYVQRFLFLLSHFNIYKLLTYLTGCIGSKQRQTKKVAHICQSRVRNIQRCKTLSVKGGAKTNEKKRKVKGLENDKGKKKRKAKIMGKDIDCLKLKKTKTFFFLFRFIYLRG